MAPANTTVRALLIMPVILRSIDENAETHNNFDNFIALAIFDKNNR